MTLAAGTAIRHGTYAIDAWVSDDAVGPVYLATAIVQGRQVLLRVLGSYAPEALPEASDRQRFYDHLEQVARLQHPALPSTLQGFEEDGVCYQILAIPPGTPLDRLVTPAAPLAPRSSLELIQRLVEGLEALRSPGWQGLRLTPDQVWYCPASQAVTLIGFDLAGFDRPEPDLDPAPPETSGQAPSTSFNTTAQEAQIVQGLSRLLYFLLVGQRAEATRAPLAVELRRRHPGLPTSLDMALETGSPQGQLPTLGLREWAGLLPLPDDLPDPPAIAAPPVLASGSTARPLPKTRLVPGGSPTAQVFPAVNGSTANGRVIHGKGSGGAMGAPARRPGRAIALALTGLVATAGGLGFGLYARLVPAGSTGQERLNPNQSFPPQPGWSSDDLWQPWQDAPSLRSRPDYSDAPPPGSQPAIDYAPSPQEPAAPPPAVTPVAPVPEVAPTAPLETLEPTEEPWLEPAIDPDPAAPDPLVPTLEPTPIPTAPPPLAPAPAAPLPSSPAGAAPPPPLTAPPGAAPASS